MMKQPILSAVTFFAATSFASAASLVVPGHTNDVSIGLNGDAEPVIAWNGEQSMLTGDDNPGSNKDKMAGIVVFELPDLAGQIIADASLDFTITGGDWVPSSAGLDLYGLRYSSSGSVLTSDYGFGPTPGNGTLIQDNLYAGFDGNMDHPFFIETDSTGNANLAIWLQDIYQAGAVAGDFIFMRLNLDTAASNPVSIAAANNNDESYRPALTITTVPEPSTYAALFGLGALGFAILRRRR